MGVNKIKSKLSSESGSQTTSDQNSSPISWTELSKHNTRDDCWIAVRGKVYDVTSWVPKHPGGEDTLVLNGGKDATILFEIYHPTKVYAMLSKYQVGSITTDEEHPSFPPMSKFYIDLKSKIEAYFENKKMSPRWAPEMLIRSVLLITVAFGLHYLSVVTPNLASSILYSMVLGVVCALICFMPVHEGSHASTTESPLMWRCLGAVHDFVNGASFYTWLHQHFLGHHPYTNVSAHGDSVAFDPDIVTHDPDLRRIKPFQKWFNHYKWQQVYMPLLYGLLGLKYRINDINIVFFTKQNGAISVNPLNAWHMTMFIAGKLFFVYYRIILPCYYIPIWQSILLFVVSDLITSYCLAFVFQVNHIIPQAKWPQVDKKTGLVNMDWAELQLTTTMDYAHDHWLTTFMTGALNYQVTHHLFPYISQIHYMEIAPIIKKHCKEAGIVYHHVPTFWDALKGHINYLGIMGPNAHSDF